MFKAGSLFAPDREEISSKPAPNSEKSTPGGNVSTSTEPTRNGKRWNVRGRNMLYRRKRNDPIDAEKFTDENNPPRGVVRSRFSPNNFIIPTCNGPYEVKIGDWIVSDGNSFYPIKDHVFRATFEPVSVVEP